MIFSAVSLSAGLVIAYDLPDRGPIPFATWDADGSGTIDEQEFNTIRTERQEMAKTSGRMGRRGQNGSGYGMAGTMGTHYQDMDAETKEKYDAFFADTVELRKEIMVKQAEKLAVMRSVNPDPDQAAQLTRELLELRSRMMAQAEVAGIAYGPGKGRGCVMAVGGKRRGSRINR